MRLPLLLLSSLLAFNMVSCQPHMPPAAEIPPAATIKAMQASLAEFPEGSPPLEEFSVPAEYFEEICLALLAAEPDPEPSKWAVLGYIEITTNSGERLFFSLYTTEAFTTEDGEQHVGLAFRTSKTDYYRGGDATELARLLRQAFESL